MAEYMQSQTAQTQQVLIGSDKNVALWVIDMHLPVNFLEDGGSPRGEISGGIINFWNFGSPLGESVEFVIPKTAGGAIKLNIAVYTIGDGPRKTRNIIWSSYAA